MWLSEEKPVIFAYKIHFISQLIATLNNYTCSLPSLANVNWSTFHNPFADHVNTQLVKWNQWMVLIWQWGPGMASTVGPHLSRPCSKILALCGTCTCHSHSKFYYLCHLTSLFTLCHHLPYTMPLPLTPLYTLAQYLWISWNNHQKPSKISHYFICLPV